MRYFIVTYVGNNNEGSSMTGSATSKVPEGYLNQSEFCEDIRIDQGLKVVIITNIIELNESDYNDWIKD